MYYLQPGGILYTITDVEDLALWHKKQLEDHPGFELLSEDELKGDSVVDAVYHSTEEGKKVERNRMMSVWIVCFELFVQLESFYYRRYLTCIL